MIAGQKPFFDKWTDAKLINIQNQLIKYAMMQDVPLPSLHRKDVMTTSDIITELVKTHETKCLFDMSIGVDAITYLSTSIGSGNERMFVEFKELRTELGRLYKSVCEVRIFE